MFPDNPETYNSSYDGAAIRVSVCGFVAISLEEAKLLAEKITEVTHNHQEGVKGAGATAAAIYLIMTGRNYSKNKRLY